MPRLLVNIDVPDLPQGLAFYSAAFGLKPGKRIGPHAIELLGLGVPIYLLERQVGSSIGPAGGGRRRYDRHWTPIHLDVAVEDLKAAIDRVTAAGAVQEGGTTIAAFGELAMLADPFGHGFCLIRFNELGYDALGSTATLPLL
ncbi:VOC family protein [Paracoccus sp. S-4012]|uniref:VOC family protein n=1 Tax=Paracoccus sp. S-4012 TaxID=2665648 RepID=UPI0012B1130E|nr:VOC family protein [Paracoccus sp. S-4012]MRX52201.1 VOC family protein [Paracoccus sp. S-4012]